MSTRNLQHLCARRERPETGDVVENVVESRFLIFERHVRMVLNVARDVGQFFIMNMHGYAPADLGEYVSKTASLHQTINHCQVVATVYRVRADYPLVPTRQNRRNLFLQVIVSAQIGDPVYRHRITIEF